MMGLRELGYGDRMCMERAQNRVHWRALLSVGLNIYVLLPLYVLRNYISAVYLAPNL